MTPPDPKRRDEITADLEEHVNMAHELPLSHAEAEVKKLTVEMAKFEAQNYRILLDHRISY